MTQNMLLHARNGNHFQEIYLDHNDSIISYVSRVPVPSSDEEELPLVKWSGPLKLDFEDVVHFPVASLPPVISPIRPLMTIPADEQADGQEVDKQMDKKMKKQMEKKMEK